MIIGDGPDFKQIKKTVHKLHIFQSYCFTGFIENVNRYLEALDILFLPTRHYEGTSLAILETQAMGKIVITSNMGGNLEVITSHKNGFIYKQMNVRKIVKLINRLVVNKSKMNAIRRKARENIKIRFELKKQATLFTKTITNL